MTDQPMNTDPVVPITQKFLLDMKCKEDAALAAQKEAREALAKLLRSYEGIVVTDEGKRMIEKIVDMLGCQCPNPECKECPPTEMAFMKTAEGEEIFMLLGRGKKVQDYMN